MPTAGPRWYSSFKCSQASGTWGQGTSRGRPMRGLRLGLWLAGLVVFAGAAGASAAPFAYIANSVSNNVSILDVATNTVVATVPVGHLAQGAAVTPNGSRVYVTNTVDNTVSVIATTTHKVVARVPVGVRPIGVAVTPNGLRAYVANIGSSTVSVINTATNRVVATVGEGPNPLGVAVTPDGSHVYVANWSNTSTLGSVGVISTATN